MSRVLILEEVSVAMLVDEEEYLVMFHDENGEEYFERCRFHYDAEDSCLVSKEIGERIIDVDDAITIFEAPNNGTIDSDEEERSDDNIIEDGFGSAWSVICPKCHKRSMFVVRPGQAQCGNCG